MRTRQELGFPGSAARPAIWFALVLSGLLVGFAGMSPATAQQESILFTEVRGVITPVIASHLADAVAQAEDGGHHALLVELDTPGGLEDSMRDIVQSFLGARVPVIVYVAPAGGRAASAGAIITFSAHVAAMAPGTNIGAATPIPLGGDGELDERVADKIVQDSVAYVEAIAQLRDRDVEFAADTVRDGRSAPAEEAREIGAIDLVAASRQALLVEIDGRSVVVDPASVEDPEGTGTEVTLATADAGVVTYEMSFTRRFLQTLANPNLALLFLSIGTLGIIYELANPGGVIGGAIGAIMLVLAFFSLAVLPVEIAGIILLLIALALFVTELFAPGIGIFAGAGAITLIFAGIFLFQRPTGIGVDLSFLIPIALAMALVAVVMGRFAWRTLRTQPYSGQGGQVAGSVGTVRESAGKTGRAMVNGQLWRIRSDDAPLERGARIEVVGIEGLELIVRPATEEHDAS